MYALASSGGKDSTLALHMARRRGIPVTHMFHLYGSEHGRVRFHGYRPELVAAQARAMGLVPIIEPTRGGELFEEDFRAALTRAKQAGLRGLVFGDIWLEEVRRYYQERVEAAGLEHLEMLWQQEPAALLEEFVEAGFRALVTCVWLKALGRDFLGRQVDRQFLRELSALKGVDVCGENGEYHTLVYGGPTFRTPLPVQVHGVHEEPDYAFLDVRLG